MNQTEIGTKLKELRQNKGLTQKDIASSLIITPQTVSKWELGISSPSLEMLVALSEIYGISVDDLIKGQTENDITVIKEDRETFKYSVVLYGIYSLLLIIPLVMIFVPYATVDILYNQLGFDFGHLLDIEDRSIIPLLVGFDDLLTYLLMFSTPLILFVLSYLDKKRISMMVFTLLIYSWLSISLFSFMASPLFISMSVGSALHIVYVGLLILSIPLVVLTSKSNIIEVFNKDWKMPLIGLSTLILTSFLPFFYNNSNMFYYEELDKLVLVAMSIVSIIVIFTKYNSIKTASLLAKIFIFIVILIATIIYIFNSGLLWISTFMYLYVLLLSFTFEKIDSSKVNPDKIRIGALYFVDLFNLVVYLYLISLSGDLFSYYDGETSDIVLNGMLPYGSLIALNLLLLLPPLGLRIAKLKKASKYAYIPYILWQLYFITDLTLRYPLQGYRMTDGMFYYIPPILYLIYLGINIKHIFKKR